jgi:dolichyl-phosphate beta-glucosyltransferase
VRIQVFYGSTVRRAIAQCRVDGFGFDVELLGRMQRAGHEIVEVPVTWIDVAGSTFSPARHGLRSFADTVRVHRLLSRAHDATLAPIIDLDVIRREVLATADDDGELVGG